jgi:hypothetical protein
MPDIKLSILQFFDMNKQQDRNDMKENMSLRSFQILYIFLYRKRKMELIALTRKIFKIFKTMQSNHWPKFCPRNL